MMLSVLISVHNLVAFCIFQAIYNAKNSFSFHFDYKPDLQSEEANILTTNFDMFVEVVVENNLNTATIVFENETNNLDEYEFLQEFSSYTLITFNHNFIKTTIIKSDHIMPDDAKIIILIFTVESFLNFQYNFKNNVGNKYCFLILIGKINNETMPTEIIKKSWRNGVIIKKLLLLQEDELIAYTFETNFTPGICKSEFKVTWSSYATRSITYGNISTFDLDPGELCLTKILWLEGNPFVSNLTSEEPRRGVLVFMFDTLSSTSGINVVYEKNNSIYEKELYTNGSHFDLVNSISEGLGDVAIGRLYMNSTHTVPCLLGPMVYKDEITFVARKPRKLQSYRKLLVVFQKDLWQAIIVSLVVMIIIYLAILRCMGLSKYRILDISTDVFKMSLGASYEALPNFNSVRCLTVFYFLFSMNMDSIYLGKLSSIFSHANYDTKVTSVSGLGLGNVYLNFSWHVERLTLLTFVTRLMKQSIQRGIHITSFTEDVLLKQVSQYQDNGTISFKSTLESNPDDMKRVDNFYVDTIQQSLFATYYVRRSHPLGEVINYWGREMIEKGFLAKWWDQTVMYNRKLSSWPELEEEDQHIRVLTIAHFVELFYILIWGYLFSLLGLIWEFIAFWLETNTKFFEKLEYYWYFMWSLLKPPKEY